MPSSSPMTVFHLSPKISSERLKREEDELLPLPLMLQSKKRRLESATREEEKKAEKGGVFLPPPPQRLLLDLNEEPKEEEEKAKKGGVGRGVFLPPRPQHLFLDLNEKPKEEGKKAKKGGVGGAVFLPPRPQRLFLNLNDETKEEEEKTKKGGGMVLPPPPPPQRLFLDLNEEPNPMWEEMVNSGKPTVVFNRLLTGSDVRKDLARCILNRTEMKEVLVPALREEERREVYDKGKKLWVAVVDGQYRKRYEMRMVWWRSLKQFALVKDWTELVHDNGLRKDDLIQLSYFRFGQQQQLGLLIQCRPEVQVMPQPDQDQEKDLQPLVDQE